MPEQPDRNRGLSAAELMQKRAAEEVARKEALHVIERRNAERLPLWSLTIRCAVVAGTPWLDVYCPGCRTSRAIDIRTLDRHPLASVGSLLLGLRCSWCPGNAPMPVSPGCTRCRRPRGGAKVCQWNSCTAALSAQRTLKGSAWRLGLSTTSMSSMTKYAVSWLATGLTCWRNFRRTKTDGEKDAVGIADAIGRPRQMTISTNPASTISLRKPTVSARFAVVLALIPACRMSGRRTPQHSLRSKAALPRP
jgi:hypothetical protein